MDDRYKNSKIYEITSNNTTMIYVGSCIVTLKRRLSEHKSKKNCSSKYIIKFGDYNINLIEEYSCNNKDELRIREQYWIDKYKREGKNIINKRDAYISEEQRLEQQIEYRENNREKNKEYQIQYYVNNREKHNERNKKHYTDNREKILERNKKHYANNRDKQKELNKEYYFMNKIGRASCRERV